MSASRPYALLASALAVLMLTGCSVPVTGGVGLTVEDDRVMAVVQMCPGYSASRVSLDLAERSDDSWDGGTWQFSSASFATVDLGRVEDFLEQVGDREVQLSSDSSSGAGGWVEFGAGDMRDLGENQILTYSWSADESRSVDLLGFEDEALAICPED